MEHGEEECRDHHHAVEYQKTPNCLPHIRLLTCQVQEKEQNGCFDQG